MSPAAKKPEPATKTVAKALPTRAKKTTGRAVVRKEEPRKLTDPRVVRALAHPVRIALLEALLREGPLTATEAAELLADSPGNMSWHLQTLAKYGYIEEADGGVGRRRPWRLVSMGTSYDENPDNTELSVAVTTLSQLGTERAFDRFRRWMNERRGYSRDWQKSWFSTDHPQLSAPRRTREARRGNHRTDHPLSRSHGAP